MSEHAVQAPSLRGADLFISDLHLQPDDPGTHQLFLSFLDRYVSEARSLTINGDFLNAYSGFRQLSLPWWKELAQRMRELEQSGLLVRFVSGNRDFMLVRDAKRMGMHGFAEQAIVESAGERIAVVHGDVFCLDDVSYLRFRKVIRGVGLPLHILNCLTPASFGQWVAGRIRKKSQQKLAVVSQRELPSYWDIKDRAVIPYAQQLGVDVVLAGHIHQPQERVYLDQAGEERFRLLIKGDWKPDRAIIAASGPKPGDRLALWELSKEDCRPWEHEAKRISIESVLEAEDSIKP